MRTKLFFVVCLSIFALSCTRTPKDKECRYLSNEDAYESYDANDGIWRTILLPGTKLGMTITTLPINQNSKSFQTPSEKGHPLKLEEIDENSLNEVRVVYWQKVENGCYCVEKLDDSGFRPWTIWTPEVFNAVQNRKSGLKGPALPSYSQESLDVFTNTTLPPVITRTSAEKIGRCTSDVLKGNFESKRFGIGNVFIRDGELGKFIIEQLEKRGAIYEDENADFGVGAWLSFGSSHVLKKGDVKNFYQEAQLEIYFNCLYDRPELENNQKPTLLINTTIKIMLNALVAQVQVENRNISEWHLAVEKLKPLIAQAIP